MVNIAAMLIKMMPIHNMGSKKRNMEDAKNDLVFFMPINGEDFIVV